MAERQNPGARIPRASYRLQFNAQFSFDQARDITGYLHELGISDVYASSYLAAKEGSVHGYDVVNQTILNREIGNEDSHRAWVEELQRLEMGQILDFVPNHMCIESVENIWWMDVLENGPSSPFANFFDIDWEPVKKELTGKVLLPFLGDQYGRVLEKGELGLSFRDGAFSVDTPGLHIPLEPKSYLQILGHRPERLAELFGPEDPPHLELLSIMTALQHLPGSTERDPERQQERHREKEIVKKRLAALCQETPAIAEFIKENLAIFNGSKGDRHSFDLLDQLLREQPYRLSYWRVATEEINYRRFFDINGLAAIRMEDAAVFNQTHQLLFRLIREGKVNGIRIDHVDGLYEPLSYLRHLQQSCYRELTCTRDGNEASGQQVQGSETASRQADAAACAAGEPGGGEGTDYAAESEKAYLELIEREPEYRPFYVVVEKILMKGEQLPKEWPVYGSTGYDFLNQVNGLFVDTENGKAFDRIYGRFTGIGPDFMDLVYQKKKLVMAVSLSGEVNMLGFRLNKISEKDRLTRDFTLNSLIRAISEVIAFFPVYRAYVSSASVREKDVQYVETAVTKAKRNNPAMNASIFDFLRDVLLLKFPEQAGDEDREAWLTFAMRFQQITGPVMAKGLEDTAFYVYNRLVSLNDVGGMPGRFGVTREAFHGQNLDRVKTFPNAMIATATHDSKRGEDVRARINALSELPEVWNKTLSRWNRLNKKKSRMVEGQKVPDRNEEYLIYQTLIGAWPPGELDPDGYENFKTRIKEYLVKAGREAKVNTSWISPNAAHEEAVLEFVDAILAREGGNLFLDDFLAFQRRIARYGMFNSLSQVMLKMTSPGFPDFYQGTELWDFTLVDPDNRRPVDYALRRQALAELKAREAELGARELLADLLGHSEDGRIKLYLIWRVLNYRREHRELFERGDYLPVEAQGARSRHVLAFLRRNNGGTLVVAVPRLVATLAPEPGEHPLGRAAWLDTWLMLPEGAPGVYRSVITGEEFPVEDHFGRRGIPLARLFEHAPVALLEGSG